MVTDSQQINSDSDNELEGLFWPIAGKCVKRSDLKKADREIEKDVIVQVEYWSVWLALIYKLLPNNKYTRSQVLG